MPRTPLNPAGGDGFMAGGLFAAYNLPPPGQRVMVEDHPARVLAVEWRQTESVILARIFRAPADPSAVPEFEDRNIPFPVDRATTT